LAKRNGMKNSDINRIIKERNVHSTFLNEEGLVIALKESYNLGVEDVLSWFSEMEHLCPNVYYLIEEWNNQNNKK
jgi:hypothetical protein